MNFLPVCLKIDGIRVAVIGGGRIAEQKIRTLALYTREIVVCAPQVSPAILALPVKVIRASYDERVLDGSRLVYACTDDRELNLRVAADARSRGALVCVADDPGACDFISPAVYRKGCMSVAVSSNASDVRRSISWRDRIAALFGDGHE